MSSRFHRLTLIACLSGLLWPVTIWATQVTQPATPPSVTDEQPLSSTPVKQSKEGDQRPPTNQAKESDTSDQNARVEDDQSKTDEDKADPLAQDPQEPSPKKKYLQIRRDADGEPVALESPVVHLVPASGDANGPRVDLIGAVHVGEHAYYQRLNKLFTEYDALLYELVAPENQKPQQGDRRGVNPVRSMQVGLKSLLQLEFQLDQIDYSRENFVHADMSPQEFARSMRGRGESFMQMYFRMLGQSFALQAQNPGQSSDVELLMALFAPDRALRLKRLMAEQFMMMDGQLAVLNGEEGSTIITERNKKALSILKRELSAGKKRIGIFYGAGHLSDMESRLVNEFGMKRDGVTWIAAWSLTSKAASATPAQP